MNKILNKVSRIFSKSKVYPAGSGGKIVILGSGWGSYSILKDIDKNLYDVSVVTPRNHFLFTPLLCSTTVGTLEFRSIIEPIRNVGFKDESNFHLARAMHLDFAKKEVICESSLKSSLSYTLKYDKLVIGVGALNNTFGVPGVTENAFFLKELQQAREIRLKIVTNCELASDLNISLEEKKKLLHTVIVGGGPTGVEFGAELYDFLKKDIKRLYGKEVELAKVTLIESNKILSSFDGRLQRYAEKKISQRERFKILKTSVTEVKTDGVVTRDGKFIPCGLVVWCAGIAPQPFTQTLDIPKNRIGQILTDSYLRVLGDPSGSTYALGDCADIEKAPLPCTAQVAERQGRYLAQCLNNKQTSSEIKPFAFKSLGMLAYIGEQQGLSDLPDLKIKGISSYFLWRSAYLSRLGSWRLRIQVPIDWTKAFLYGRDISKF